MPQFFQELLPDLKYIVPGIVLVLVAALVAIGNRKPAFWHAMLLPVFLIASVLSVTDQVKGNIERGDYLNAYEFFHYYLAAKYHKELGYTDLYNAAIVAQSELGHKFIPGSIRNLDGGSVLASKQVIANAAEYKAGFSESRWNQFKQDVDFCKQRFQRNDVWTRVVNDKGYNGTPVWTMVGGIIANRVPAQSSFVYLLPFIDVVLFVLALLALWWAFDWRVALLLLIFLCSHYLTSHPTLKAAFMRLDWLACLIVAAACIRKDYYVLAGVLTAYAACMRLFPAVFVFGIGALMLWNLWDRRRISGIDPRYWRFTISFTAAVAALVLASVAYTGAEYWAAFFKKIGDHGDDISSWRVGFKYVFLWMREGGTPSGLGPVQHLEQYALVYRGMQMAAVAVTFVTVRKLKPYEAYAFGFIPCFFLSAATFYYYVSLALPFIFFAAQTKRFSHAAGLAIMFATSIYGHYGFSLWDRGNKLFFDISFLILLMCAYMWLLGAWQWYWESRRKPEAASPEVEAGD